MIARFFVLSVVCFVAVLLTALTSVYSQQPVSVPFEQRQPLLPSELSLQQPALDLQERRASMQALLNSWENVSQKMLDKWLLAEKEMLARFESDTYGQSQQELYIGINSQIKQRLQEDPEYQNLLAQYEQHRRDLWAQGPCPGEADSQQLQNSITQDLKVSMSEPSRYAAEISSCSDGSAVYLFLGDDFATAKATFDQMCQEGRLFRWDDLYSRGVALCHYRWDENALAFRRQNCLLTKDGQPVLPGSGQSGQLHRCESQN